MAMIQNFNRLIDIELYSDSQQIKIQCPAKGRKPSITIKGTLIPSNLVNQFEIHVKNLYISDLQEYNKIKVSAGYEGNKSTSIVGSITNSYVQSPAPEQETVFICLMGDYGSWIDKTVDVHFTEGDGISDILQALTSALGFESPQIADDVTETLKAPLDETRLAKDVLQTLRQSFPDVVITVDSNRFIVYHGDKGTQKTYELKYVSSPVQVQANTITVTAPWEPQVRYGDHIKIQTAFYSKDMTAKSMASEYIVNSLQFSFSTTGSENSMTIQGIAV